MRMEDGSVLFMRVTPFVLSHGRAFLVAFLRGDGNNFCN
jgi:hypothetical protein